MLPVKKRADCIHTEVCGNYIKEAAPSTDAQQLKAEIAALADKLSGNYGFYSDIRVRCIVDEMRQLST